MAVPLLALALYTMVPAPPAEAMWESVLAPAILVEDVKSDEDASAASEGDDLDLEDPALSTASTYGTSVAVDKSVAVDSLKPALVQGKVRTSPDLSPKRR